MSVYLSTTILVLQAMTWHMSDIKNVSSAYSAMCLGEI